MSTEHAREKPASSPTLSVCLIVKNEAERLPSAVESVKGVATEVVVVDTGSGDDTVPVARSLGARVLEIQWQDDFSHARNASLEAATGDWILCLDADEKLAPGQQGKLRRLLSGRADACYVMIRSPMAGHRRGQTFVHAFQRLFRNRPQYRYQGRVHEQIYPALSAAGARLVFSDLEIDHSGYALAPHFQESKLRRNLELLHLDFQDRPDDGFVCYHLGETYALLGEAEKARRCYDLALRLGNLPPGHTASTHQNLASILLRLRELDPAVEEAEEALKLNPVIPTPLLILASALCQRGEHRSAIRTADRYLKKCRHVSRQVSGQASGQTPVLMTFEPDPARAFLIRGESYLQLGELHEAQADAERVITHNPEWPEGYRLLARVAGAGDSPARALAAVDAAIGKNPQAGLYGCQGLLRIKVGDFAAAAQSYRHLLELDPGSHEAHRRLAGLYHKMGDVSQAREHLAEFRSMYQGPGAVAAAPFPPDPKKGRHAGNAD